MEEAQELAEATEPDHVAAEAADLIYFALTRQDTHTHTHTDERNGDFWAFVSQLLCGSAGAWPRVPLCMMWRGIWIAGSSR